MTMGSHPPHINMGPPAASDTLPSHLHGAEGPMQALVFLFFQARRRRRTFEVRGNPYVRGENNSVYDEHERQLATLANTQQQVDVAAVAVLVGQKF